MYKGHVANIACVKGMRRSHNIWMQARKTVLYSNTICRMANAVIPLVDLNDLESFPKDSSSQPAEKLQAISLECADALRKYGIMYLRNHGIPQELVSYYNHNQLKQLYLHVTLYLVIKLTCLRV